MPLGTQTRRPAIRYRFTCASSGGSGRCGSGRQWHAQLVPHADFEPLDSLAESPFDSLDVAAVPLPSPFASALASDLAGLFAAGLPPFLKSVAYQPEPFS